MKQRNNVAKYFLTALFAFLVLAPTATRALDVQLFEPVPWVSRGVTVFGSSTLKRHSFETGAYLNWARNPIEFGLSGQRIDNVLDDLLGIDMQFAYGLSDKWMLSGDIPFYPFYNLEPLGVSTKRDGATVGDLRLNTVWQIIPRGTSQMGKWGFAAIPFLTIPVGNEDKFVGNSNFTGGFRFALDRDLTAKDYLKFNVGFRFRETEKILNLEINHEVFSSIGYNRLVWKSQDLDLFAELFGSTTTANFCSQEISSPMEVYLGARKGWMKGKLQTVLGLGRGLNNGYGAPDVRVFAGATLAIGKRTTPVYLGKLILTIREENGTPHPGKIQLTSVEDNTFQQNFDSDKFETTLKPKKYSFTVDVDGYFREVGQVIIASKQTTRVEIILRPLLGKKIEAVGQVLFDLNMASIKEESHPVLQGIIDILNRYPELSKLQIEAHTDSDASEKYNNDLSDRRSKSVADYLESQGVAATRLSSKGWGELKPIATNNTREGRARNRRVEFVILEILPENVVVKQYAPTELYNLEEE